jgi:hypothetical protein
MLLIKPNCECCNGELVRRPVRSAHALQQCPQIYLS